MEFLLDTDTLIYWMKNVPDVVDNNPKCEAAGDSDIRCYRENGKRH
jgi:hypothetical protein